jgi:hypothetical protein
MKYAIFLVLFLMVGCWETIPTKQEFPSPPSQLMEPPIKLVPLKTH